MVSRVLYANNQQCNLIPAVVGIFLHACNAPERVVDVLWRMNTSMSIASINNAINSLSVESAINIKEAGQTLLYSYVLDNFDIQLKHKTTTVEQSTDTLFHLISASLIKLVHATKSDLKFSPELWEKSRFNDRRKTTEDSRSIYDLFLLHPDHEDSTGLDRKERFNAWRFMMDICTHGPPYFHQFRSALIDPEAVEMIPPVKTVQVPAKAMHLSNASVDGNIRAATELLHQGGIQETQEYVILFHGDLGTVERLRTAKIYRSIESTPFQRLQYLITLPGVFHTEMACADALYRMFLGPKAGHKDETSFNNYVEVLYPTDSSRIANNKGSFQQLSNCIVQTGISDRLECWRAYIQSKNLDCDTLDKYAQTAPTLSELLSISRVLAQQYNSLSLFHDSQRKIPMDHRDQQYENTIARINYFLLYEETIYSIRHGDIGRLEICLRTWLPVFKGTGKHKYASMILDFMLDVHFLFPAPLKKVVRYNWLCNPRGTRDGFRGVDWLLEINNLLTKVIYGGSSSNYTLDRIIKESPLIQLYRDCKTIIEEQFHLKPKTTRHGEPDLSSTYAVLSEMAVSSSLLTHKPGRTSEYAVPDVATIGMRKYEVERSGIVSQGISLADDGTQSEEPSFQITATDAELYLE